MSSVSDDDVLGAGVWANVGTLIRTRPIRPVQRKPKLAAVAGSKLPNCGAVDPKLSWLNARSRSAVGPVGDQPMPML